MAEFEGTGRASRFQELLTGGSPPRHGECIDYVIISKSRSVPWAFPCSYEVSHPETSSTTTFGLVPPGARFGNRTPVAVEFEAADGAAFRCLQHIGGRTELLGALDEVVGSHTSATKVAIRRYRVSLSWGADALGTIEVRLRHHRDPTQLVAVDGTLVASIERLHYSGKRRSGFHPALGDRTRIELTAAAATWPAALLLTAVPALDLISERMDAYSPS